MAEREFTQDEQDKWNSQVMTESVKTDANKSIFQPTSLEVIKRQQDAIFKKEVDIWNNVSAASFTDKLGAMYDIGKLNNDFYRLGRYTEKPEFELDRGWIDFVSLPQNSEELARQFDVPSNMFIEDIGKTSSYKEFEFLVNRKKEDFAILEDIQNTTQSNFLLGTGAVVGAVAGFDLALLAIPYIGELNLARKVGKALSTVEDVVAMEALIKKREKVTMAAGVTVGGLAIPLAREVIDEDYKVEDFALDFFLNVGGGLLLKEWKFSKYNNKMLSVRENLKAKELLDLELQANIGKSSEWFPSGAADEWLPYGATSVWSPYGATSEMNYIHQLSLPYNKKEGLLPAPKTSSSVIHMGTTKTSIEPIIVGTKGVGLNNSPIELGSISKMTKQLDIVKKELSAAQRIVDEGKAGKELIAKTNSDITKLSDDVKVLEASLVKLKKTKDIAKKFEVINDVAKRFPNAFAKDLIPELTPIVEQAFKHLEDLDVDGGLKTAVDKVVKKHGGERIVVKTDESGVKVGVITKNNKFKEIVGNNKLLGASAATMIGASAATADDGSVVQEIGGYALGAFLLWFGGSKLLKAAFNDGVVNSARNSMNSIVKAVASRELATSPSGEYVGRLYAAYNSALVALGFTFKTLYYKSNIQGKELAKKLFFDFEGTGSKLPAETLKHLKVEEHAKAFYESYNNAFSSYLESKKLARTSKVDLLINRAHHKKEFNELITFAAENPKATVAKEVRDVANVLRKILDDIETRAISEQVAGFAKGKHIKDYIPRMTKNADVFQLISMSDGLWDESGTAYLALKNNFKRMYESAHPGKDGTVPAEEFMNGILQGQTTGVLSFGDLLGDTINFSKARIPLDLSMWKDFDIVIAGEKKTFSLSTLYERDAEVIMNHYSNAMEGHIAMAQHGIKNYTDAIAIGATQPEVAHIFEKSINQLIGKSNYDTSTNLSQVVTGVSNLAPIKLMPLSAIMQIYEAGTIFIRSTKKFSTFMTGIRETINVLRKRGTNDPMVSFLMELNGFGSSIVTNKLHARLVDDAVNNAESYGTGLASEFAQKSKIAKDVAMIAYGVAPLTDIGHRVATKLNMYKVLDIAHGKTTISPILSKIYGLDTNTLALIKSIPMSPNGKWTKNIEDYINANPKVKEAVQRTSFLMTNANMIIPTIGGTPNMFRESALGHAMGTLMSFAANSAATYGVRHVKGISQGDIGTMLDVGIWFGAMVLAQALKDEIKGKERDEQEIIMAALLQMPMTAPVGVVTSMFDPAISSVPEQALLTANHLAEMFKDD